MVLEINAQKNNDSTYNLKSSSIYNNNGDVLDKEAKLKELKNILSQLEKL